MRAAASIALAALLLTGAGPPEPSGYRLDDYRAPVPETVAGGEVLSLPAMRRVVAAGEAALIDVLPAPRRPETMRPEMPWLPQPHRSLPGAVWWPDVGRGALSPGAEGQFRARLAQVAGPERKRELVFFCLSACWMSWNAAKRAASWGYRVGWFPDGVDGWEAAGLPTEIVRPTPLE